MLDICRFPLEEQQKHLAINPTSALLYVLVCLWKVFCKVPDKKVTPRQSDLDVRNDSMDAKTLLLKTVKRLIAFVKQNMLRIFDMEIITFLLTEKRKPICSWMLCQQQRCYNWRTRHAKVHLEGWKTNYLSLIIPDPRQVVLYFLYKYYTFKSWTDTCATWVFKENTHKKYFLYDYCSKYKRNRPFLYCLSLKTKRMQLSEMLQQIPEREKYLSIISNWFKLYFIITRDLYWTWLNILLNDRGRMTIAFPQQDLPDEE